MGYTNYWNMSEDREREFSDKFIEDANKIIKASCIPVANGTGDKGTTPIITKNHILLNGVEENSHETFGVFLNDEDTFWFCKTNRKSYDLVVKCLLMLLDEYGYLKEWSFDGDTTDSEYVRANNLYNSVFNKAV